MTTALAVTGGLETPAGSGLLRLGLHDEAERSCSKQVRRTCSGPPDSAPLHQEVPAANMLCTVGPCGVQSLARISGRSSLWTSASVSRLSCSTLSSFLNPFPGLTLPKLPVGARMRAPSWRSTGAAPPAGPAPPEFRSTSWTGDAPLPDLRVRHLPSEGDPSIGRVPHRAGGTRAIPRLILAGVEEGITSHK